MSDQGRDWHRLFDNCRENYRVLETQLAEAKAEIERLKNDSFNRSLIKMDAELAEAKAEIERLKIDRDAWMGPKGTRYEAVVEAARAYVQRIENEAAKLPPWDAPELDDGIRAALAALEDNGA